MNHETIYDQNPKRFVFPPLGQRIVKTTVAVFLCLLVYYLRGYRGSEMPTESCITAIICMQPYVRQTGAYALNRLAGTLIGAFWGLMFLLLLLIFPRMGSVLPILYARMAIGVLLSLYTAVLLKKPDTAALAAIVFLCVVIAFPDIEDPLRQAVERIVDIFIGTFAAIVVNVFHLPREKMPDQVFFVRTKDLVPDRFAPVSAAVMFHLNYLYEDGARICLMSEHAPAFFVLQMNATRVNTPLIVMDGAAIYDFNENCFLQVQTIPQADSKRLRERLDGLGLSYFIYTVHHNKTCIFHRGSITEAERKVLDRMKRSPYRDYLEGEVYEEAEVVYYKILDTDAKLAEMEAHLSGSMPKARLRAVRRKQAGAPGISGLYIYAHTSTMEQAEKRLLSMLREENPRLAPKDIRLRSPYQSERDAMHLIHLITKSYEPVRLFARLKRKRSKKEKTICE